MCEILVVCQWIYAGWLVVCKNPCPVGGCNWHVTKAYLVYEQPSTSEDHSDPWASLSFMCVQTQAVSAGVLISGHTLHPVMDLKSKLIIGRKTEGYCSLSLFFSVNQQWKCSLEYNVNIKDQNSSRYWVSDFYPENPKGISQRCSSAGLSGCYWKSLDFKGICITLWVLTNAKRSTSRIKF